MKRMILITTLVASIFVQQSFAQSPPEEFCRACSTAYVDTFLKEYFRTVSVLSDTFCSDCFQSWMRDSALINAYHASESLPCIDTHQTVDRVDIHSLIVQQQFRADLSIEELDFAIMINNWLGFNPQAFPDIILSVPGCDLAYFFDDIIDTSVLQPNSITLNIAEPNRCLDAVLKFPFFSGVQCDSIFYRPYRNFTGRDTGYYIICDSNLVCDTGAIIINVIPDYSLWPEADFSENVPLSCTSGPVDVYVNHYTLINTSTNEYSYFWDLTFYFLLDSILYSDCLVDINEFGDSLVFSPGDYVTHGCQVEGMEYLEVCLYATNEYGIDRKCDTICNLVWEAISELQLSPIQLYPNPAQNRVTIVVHASEIGSYAQLTDISGKKKALIQLKNQKTILETDELRSGVYFLQIKSKKAAYGATKLIVD